MYVIWMLSPESTLIVLKSERASRVVPPPVASVFETPQNLLDLAREEIAPIYATYRACMEYGAWPGYGDDVQQLEFPRWAFKNREEK